MSHGLRHAFSTSTAEAIPLMRMSRVERVRRHIDEVQECVPASCLPGAQSGSPAVVVPAGLPADTPRSASASEGQPGRHRGGGGGAPAAASVSRQSSGASLPTTVPDSEAPTAGR